MGLSDHIDQPLSMVVVHHGKPEPMVLVSTQWIRGRLQGRRLIQSYMSRWACEEGYRLTKQGVGMERVQASTLSTLQNLVSLATLSWGRLSAHESHAEPYSIRRDAKSPKGRWCFRFTPCYWGGSNYLRGLKPCSMTGGVAPKRMIHPPQSIYFLGSASHLFLQRLCEKCEDASRGILDE